MLKKEWQKSTKSSPSGDNCVEARVTPSGTVLVRNSKSPEGAVVEFTPAEWGAFLGGVKENEFDLA